jgi:rhamnogalacturonyl hydrolase YesR
LADVIEKQGKEAQIYLSVDCATGLPVKDGFKDDVKVLFVLDSRLPGQAHWFSGFPITVLCMFHKRTSDERWLGAARQWFEFAARCHADRDTVPAACKLGYGAACLYTQTGDKQYLACTEAVANMMLGSQRDDGAWLLKDFATLEDQPWGLTCDLVCEFMMWLHEYDQVLNGPGIP